MLRIVIVFGLLAIVGGIATWRPDLAEQAYNRTVALVAGGKQDATPAPAAGGQAARGQQRRQAPPISVTMARAERRDMPVQVEAVGTVQAIASLQIKSRIDSQVVTVHVAEGASVKQGDLLFSLDDRTLKAQLAQLDAQVLRSRAQLEQANRDRDRAADLARRNVGTDVARDNAISNAKVAQAQLAADQANRDNIATQLSYTQVRAPVSGRIGSIAAKAGAFVRSADATAMTTINQIDPIYIAFAIPQATFYELRTRLENNAQGITVEAQVGDRRATGSIAFIENQIDLATGTVTAKALMQNGTELLWPGAFVPVKIVLGHQPNAIVVPTVALQVGQNGPFVFVARDGKAAVTPVTVARTIGDMAVIATGLEGGEDVVTSGQLRLTAGSSVVARPPATSQAPAADRQS